MNTEILESLGLSKGEIKSYLTLLELGKTKVGQIIEKSGLASSAVHNSLNSLTEKGLVSYIRMGKIKFYHAVPPKQLLNFIEDKKKKLNEILPELEALNAPEKEKQEAEIFQGIKGVISMLNILIEQTKKGDEFLFFPPNIPEKNEEVQTFYEMYDAKRKSKGLITKGIAPETLKEYFSKRHYLKMKYSMTDLPPNLAVCNNTIAIISWGEKPVGYLIKSKQIADMYKAYFNALWKNL